MTVSTPFKSLPAMTSEEQCEYLVAEIKAWRVARPQHHLYPLPWWMKHTVPELLAASFPGSKVHKDSEVTYLRFPVET